MVRTVIPMVGVPRNSPWAMRSLTTKDTELMGRAKPSPSTVASSSERLELLIFMVLMPMTCP